MNSTMNSSVASVLTAEEAENSLFGYKPMLAPNAVFLALYALTTIVHIIQVFIYREWWLFILPIGTLAEVGGYIPRILGRDHEKLMDPDKMRDTYVATMCLLIITPCLFAAVHFTTLGRVTTLFPRKYVFIRPIFIMPLFVTIDVISLVVQGVGAGSSATADSDEDAKPGSHVTEAGVAVQLFGYLIYMILLLTFCRAVRKDPPPGIDRFWPLLIATFFSSLCIILRSIYRLVEMGMGWTGKIATTEWFLFAFDSSFVLVACVILNIWNPGRYLPKNFSWRYNPERDPTNPNYQGTLREEDPEKDHGGPVSPSDDEHFYDTAVAI